jgi:hypothetical protein
MAFSRPGRSVLPQTDIVRDIPVTNTEKLCVTHQTPKARGKAMEIGSYPAVHD